MSNDPLDEICGLCGTARRFHNATNGECMTVPRFVGISQFRGESATLRDAAIDLHDTLVLSREHGSAILPSSVEDSMRRLRDMLDKESGK